MKFELGMKLRDKITGFEGVAIARTEWLYSCLRYTLCPTSVKKDGGLGDNHTFDEPQLELVEEVVKYKVHPTGGPGPEPQRSEDPSR